MSHRVIYFCPVNMLWKVEFKIKNHFTFSFFFLRLFQHIKRGSSTLKALPLKLQQTAFENAYLKAQEGMRELVILVMYIC